MTEKRQTVGYKENYKAKHVTKEWVGDQPVRNPICPFGCDKEGILLEVIQTADGAVGRYMDPAGCCRFEAKIAAKPKPNARKIVIGPDGQPTISSGDA